MFTLFFANDFEIKTIKYILKCKFLTTICTPAQNKEKNERTRQEQLSISLSELRFMKCCWCRTASLALTGSPQ